MKSHYTGLWLLLAVSLACVVFLSFADPVEIGSWEVKKAPFAQTLFPDDKESGEAGNVASKEILAEGAEISGTPLEPAEPEKIETDSVPKSILLFGDSMTFNMALRMAKYAAFNGHSFHAVNWDSSNTKIWAESDTLEHFIRQYRADFIFVSLGSNELYFKNPDSRLPYVKKILSKIGDIPYVWIGPPNWKEDSGINDMLERTCSPRSFFRSAGMDFKRKADHIHPTRQSSAMWVDSVMRWIPTSGHPILASLPPDSLDKVTTNVVFLKALNK